MDKKNKNPNVPNLRFSNQYKLRKVRLGDICTITGGYAFDSHKMKQQGEYQIIKMGNLYNGIFDLSRNQSFINAPTKKELEYLIQKNDILITLTGTTNKKDYGYTVQIEKPKKLLLNQRCALIRASKVNEKYLFYLLNSNDFLKQFYASSTGGTGNQANVSINDMLDFKVYISNENDQLKISNILNALDKKISTQIKIIEDYKVLKKKICKQVIGSQKPNTHIYECLENNSSSSKESDFDDYTEGQFPIYGANGVIKHINSYLIDIPSISIVKDGAGVGRTRFLYGKYTVIGTLNYLTSKNGYDLLYLYYALDNLDFTKYIVGSGIPHIYFKDYKCEMIYIPKDEKTINKIVRCLSSLDLLIHNEQNLLLYLTKQKEYLLNNMFI